MANLVPIATYNLNLQPFSPSAAIELEFPTTIRITAAAIDPEAVDEEGNPSTLRMLKRKLPFDDDSDSEDEDFEVGDDSEEEDELDEQEEEEEKEQEKEEEDEDKSDEDSEEDDLDLEIEDEEYVICTLSPKFQYQQVLDITIQPDEEVYFVVTGSYPIHLSGNYVDHPDDEDSDEDSEEDYDSDEYDLTPDEEELYDLEDLEDASDIENKIEELVEQDQKNNKRKTEVEEEQTEEVKPSKKAKKDKKAVQFPESLEHGPGAEYSKKETKKEKKEKKEKAVPEAKKEESKKQETKKDEPKKFPTKTLLGGVVTEDRKVGKGQTAKTNNKVGIRYIGKLKNGKVFDKNTSGKPFVFGLGKGECIKGFDLGVAGMAVGGERRVVIPAKMGYGSQALPGIPANSELTFDIKLVSLK
ncbi:peptidylprolyl isomerase fpr3 [Yamadazyma tenuis]|uniref:peptidylprolyl isomerase fpr3 n=1 Tax=Candida tenuis TaxID=2315449 RepID=UPI0027A563EC|nr:peptidylprolyl isomerase fpr3 [Yamadazyma tenuis]